MPARFVPSVMPSRTLRILSVGYCFPPVASAESYVTAKVMGALPDARVDVLTAVASYLSRQLDRSLDAYVAARFGRIMQVAAPAIVRALVQVPRLPLRPDRWLLLNRSLVRHARTLDIDTYDCIVTRSQYHSAHLVGLALKRQHSQLPWLASFSDPWTGAVYERSVPLLSAWSRSMERQVLASADALVFPTDEMRDFVARNHDDLDILARSAIVPHGFDPALSAQAARLRLQARPLRIGLFGSFYGPRSPAPLLAGLAALRDGSGPEVRLEVYGPNAALFAKSLECFPDLATTVVHGGALDHLTALRRMPDCDLLVMVDAPMESPSIFLPSKLVDYIGSGRPILAITPDGAAARIARSVGGVVAPPNNPSAIGQALVAAIALARSQPSPLRTDRHEVFEIGRVAADLRRAIEEAIRRCAAR